MTNVQRKSFVNKLFQKYGRYRWVVIVEIVGGVLFICSLAYVMLKK